MEVIPNKAGIYKLTCSNGKIYIGKSVNIRHRISQHKISKDNTYLQNAIRKHGWDEFSIEVLEIIENFDKQKDNNILLEKESYYIKLLDSTNRDKGYNICEYSNDTTGKVVSEESRQKMRLAKLGNKINVGKTHSKEAKEKMRLAKLGKSNIACVGKSLSEETKLKISKSKSGKSLSKTHKDNISNANKGRVVSEETKEKIRLNNIGKHSNPRKKKNGPDPSDVQL